MKRSDSEIAAYAKGAGISGGNVAVAVAIALAESGGDDHSHNPVPPDDSYGLWQINMLGSLGPSRRQQFGISSNEALYDPGTNAKAMAILSGQGSNWRPWTTYTSGKYRMFLARGETAAGTSADVTTQTVSLPSLSGLSKLADLFTDKGTWIRVGMTLAGVILIALALIRLTGINPLPQAKMLKLAKKVIAK